MSSSTSQPSSSVNTCTPPSAATSSAPASAPAAGAAHWCQAAAGEHHLGAPVLLHPSLDGHVTYAHHPDRVTAGARPADHPGLSRPIVMLPLMVSRRRPDGLTPRG